MPKYYQFKVCGYYLYFTAHCVVEAMHIHAGDKRLTEFGSAKFFVRADGSTFVQNRGKLTDFEVDWIQLFISDNYRDMYLTWSMVGPSGYFGE